MDLYTHMEWADGRVWRAVLQTEKYSKDDAILDLLAHLHMTQHAFLDVWMGRPVERRDARAEFDAPVALGAWARTFYPEAAQFLETADVKGLDQALPLPWAHYFREVIGRDPTISTLRDTLFQLALHSVHHRAQVVRQIRVLGGQPPMVDYIAWVWAGRPAAEWFDAD